MDLGAYAQINELEGIMESNGIDVPRLRGLRLMKNEEPVSKEKIAEMARDLGIDACEWACREGFRMNARVAELSQRTDEIVDWYMLKDDDGNVCDVNWSRVHGKKRKLFKYNMRKAKKQLEKQYEVFNRYCGREDVLYIHARIGGGNWNYYNCDELKQKPWFLEVVADAYDETYCDIYARIDVV